MAPDGLPTDADLPAARFASIEEQALMATSTGMLMPAEPRAPIGAWQIADLSASTLREMGHG